MGSDEPLTGSDREIAHAAYIAGIYDGLWRYEFSNERELFESSDDVMRQVENVARGEWEYPKNDT